jgi:SAM-dependent methyltransferase
MTEANAEMVRYWNEVSGPKWVALQELIDRQIEPLGERAFARAALTPGERVLDVGCGCGSTTLAAAERVGPSGEAFGVDLSAPMLARARERSNAAGLERVRFAQADAQTALLPQGFDVLFSRFGVMFFESPEAAFANLRRALRPGGRLAFVCWQEIQRNPWMVVPVGAVAGLLPLPASPPPGAPGPFAFADTARVSGILESAGFAQIAFESVEEMLSVGPGDLDGTARFLLSMGPAATLLREAQGDPALEERAFEAVRAAIAPHLTPDGVRMASASWIVTARNPEAGGNG